MHPCSCCDAFFNLAACAAQNTGPLSTPETNSSEIETPEVIEAAAEANSDLEHPQSSIADNDDAGEETLVRITAAAGLRMREGPGTDYDIIKVIAVDEFVEELEHSDSNPDWIYVHYDGDNGWINTGFIEYVSIIAAENWAQVYYDYLNGFEPIRHSDYCEIDWCTDNFVHLRERSGKEMDIFTFGIAFRSIPGYDYPIMFRALGPPHAGGAYVVELIENDKIVTVYEYRDSGAFFEGPDGQYRDPKGELIKEFDYRDDSANMLDVLPWLRTQM